MTIVNLLDLKLMIKIWISMITVLRESSNAYGGRRSLAGASLTLSSIIVIIIIVNVNIIIITLFF